MRGGVGEATETTTIEVGLGHASAKTDRARRHRDIAIQEIGARSVNLHETAMFPETELVAVEALGVDAPSHAHPLRRLHPHSLPHAVGARSGSESRVEGLPPRLIEDLGETVTHPVPGLRGIGPRH